MGNVRLGYGYDGKIVAEAGKPGWYPDPIGWAADSSGVYFRLIINGEMAGMITPYTPIFKLSPLTPEEERAQW